VRGHPGSRRRPPGCSDYGAAPQLRDIPARGQAELPTVLPIELGRTAVSDSVSHLGHTCPGGQERARLLQLQALLELQRRQSGEPTEMTMKGRHAHRGDPREFWGRHGFGEVRTDVGDGIGNVAQDAVCKTDLRDAVPERSTKKSPQDLSFDEGREDRRIDRMIEQSEHSEDRIEKVVAGRVSSD
jgi:hypothetical protein